MEEKKIKLIANWKSHKTAEETILFLDGLKELLFDINLANKEIIILPPYLSIPPAAAFIESEQIPIALGAQDISPFDTGAYTGEVNGFQIAEFCTYTLINHSERRRYSHEADQEARSKVLMAKKYNLIPLFCIQDEQAAVPDGVTEIMFEPPSAISTFTQNAQAEDSNEIERVFTHVSGRIPESHLYYGGSVDVGNIQKLLSVPQISGFLIGSASLDIETFAQLLISF